MPTAIEQSCPGCPCAGLSFTFEFWFEPVVCGFEIVNGEVCIDWLIFDCNGAGAVAGGVVVDEEDKFTGDEELVAFPFKGAPTAISQRCPGCP